MLTAPLEYYFRKGIMNFVDYPFSVFAEDNTKKKQHALNNKFVFVFNKVRKKVEISYYQLSKLDDNKRPLEKISVSEKEVLNNEFVKRKNMRVIPYHCMSLFANEVHYYPVVDENYNIYFRNEIHYKRKDVWLWSAFKKKYDLKTTSKIPGRITNNTKSITTNNLMDHIRSYQTDHSKSLVEWKSWRNNFLINKNSFPGELLFSDNIVYSHNLF